MNKILLIALMVFINTAVANAQDRQSLDSTQRQRLKDSLQINDATVTRIYVVRDNMYSQIDALQKDNMLSENERDRQIETIRRNTNSSIRQLLGDNKYLYYKEMIRRRVNLRNTPNKDPLAGDN